MAIQISGCTVIDNNRNICAGIATFSALFVPPAPITFNPSNESTVDPATLNAIQIGFNVSPMTKGTGNITLRSGSANGTILETIPVSSSKVTISSGVVTINPASDNLPGLTNVYVVVDAGAFVGPNDTYAVSANSPLINTYNFFIGELSLGSLYEGGILICKSSPTRWIVSPCSAGVTRYWSSINDSNIRAQQVSGCTGWFVPSALLLQNPGAVCRQYWNTVNNTHWSSTSSSSYYNTSAIAVTFGGSCVTCAKEYNPRSRDPAGGFLPVRSFRCVTY